MGTFFLTASGNMQKQQTAVFAASFIFQTRFRFGDIFGNIQTSGKISRFVVKRANETPHCGLSNMCQTTTDRFTNEKIKWHKQENISLNIVSWFLILTMPG